MFFRQIFRKCFKILSITLVILAIAEGTLWLVNRDRSKLFVESENDQFLKINQGFVAPFASPKNLGYLASKTIKKDKEKNTYRIFIVGERLQPEIPYNPNSNFAHLLNLKLQRTFQDKNIEMINIAYDSASSFEMLKTVRQIKNYGPDLVILCPGRNEFYGRNTYASNVFTGNEKLDRWIQNTNICQFFRKYFTYPKTRFDIETNSDEFRKIIERFEYNLDETVLTLQTQNIPIMIVNTASNLLDEPPLKSRFFSPYATQLQNLLEEGKKAYLEGNDAFALSCFQKIYRKEMTHAETLYYLGKLALRENKSDEAKKFLRLAANHDLIKNRIPSAINESIFSIAAVRGCPLVDLENALSKIAVGGIPGNDFFIDDNYLNLKGNVILARTCSQTIIREVFSGKCDTQDKELFSGMALTPFDTVLDRLMSENSEINSQVTTSFEERMVSLFANDENTWEESMNKLYEYYMKNKSYKLAFKVIENLVLENPYNIKLNDKASQTAALLGDSQMVVHYASRVYKAKQNPVVAERIFIGYLKLDRPESALPYIEFVKKQSDNEDYNLIYTTTNQIINLKKLLKHSPDNKLLREQISKLYLSIGNEDIALTYAKPNPIQSF